jgi:hypothetical protein
MTRSFSIVEAYNISANSEITALDANLMVSSLGIKSFRIQIIFELLKRDIELIIGNKI